MASQNKYNGKQIQYSGIPSIPSMLLHQTDGSSTARPASANFFCYTVTTTIFNINKKVVSKRYHLKAFASKLYIETKSNKSLRRDNNRKEPNKQKTWSKRDCSFALFF